MVIVPSHAVLEPAGVNVRFRAAFGRLNEAAQTRTANLKNQFRKGFRIA
jgi:hypothetical protein